LSSWLGKFERDLRKLEFVLHLSDELAQLLEQPTEDILERMASKFKASEFMISLEYDRISKICCARRGKRTLEETTRGSLNPRKVSIGPIVVPVAMSITSFAQVVAIHFQ
jgi:hypothetical protein